MALLRRIFLLATWLSAYALLAQAQNCGLSNPCEVGCCGPAGYCGFGPDYCELGVCVSQCDAKADCDPGGLGAEWVNKTTCPLNVCCSEHGFCGMTAEFCGDNQVTKPDCSSSQKSFKRVVGYYEGWAMGRPCNAFNPEKIPLGVYTHINFAFATIDPNTFEVLPATEADKDLYKRLTDLKRFDPDLKVMVAIGGWTFNDAHMPTATTFSDIARSEQNSVAFILSLIKFMNTYDFDGVDLDWEYPVARDRSGRDEDYENFPAFLERLKYSLLFSGMKSEVSITVPASYWYLQHFDIKRMESSVDFFNVMSYDLHGTWDIPNKWVGPYLNAHTNLTEIDQALDLLWRNDISPDKVVMGLAFYGRAFRANSASCLAPGCTYGSGAPAQPCSNEIGVILNSEIEDVMASTGAQPVLYEEAAVKVLAWDSTNWVAYDDEDTLAAKVDFARDRCLNGVMVWAISHDTHDGKYSKALGEVARSGASLQFQTDGSAETYDTHPQCKWTNCGQSCPSGYTVIKRSDPDARDGEIMLDGQGCDGHGVHTFCCPAGYGLPTCGWYGHNNGNCQPTCPSGHVEVGSNNQYCGTRSFLRGYQAACCTKEIGIGSGRVVPESMALHEQCEWLHWPQCPASPSSCPAGEDRIVENWDGSGGAWCYMGGRSPYCCDQPDEKKKWGRCAWYRGFGDGPSGKGACRPGCPENLVRVAMSMVGCARGASAYCCEPLVKKLSKRDDQYAMFQDALEDFLADPVCPDNYIPPFKRSIEAFDNGTTHAPYEVVLSRRVASESVVNAVFDLASRILYSVGDLALVTIWDNNVGAQFPNLEAADLVEYRTGGWFDDVFRSGTARFLEDLVCNMASTNDLLGGDDGSALQCDAEGQCAAQGLFRRGLEKRTREYDWNATANGVNWSGEIRLRPYPSANQWDWTDPSAKTMYQNIYLLPSRGCANLRIRILDWLRDRQQDTLADTNTEHILDGQVIPQWYVAAIQGRLADGSANPAGAIPGDFFQDTLPNFNVRSLPNPPSYARGGAALVYPQDRLMNALGSNNNRDVFAIADVQLNCIKNMLFSGREQLRQNPVSRSQMDSYTSTHDIMDAEIALTEIRNVISLISYLNEARIHRNLRNIIMEFRRELNVAERAHAARTGVQVRARENFENWIQSFAQRLVSDIRLFVNRNVARLQNTWRNDNSPDGRSVWADMTRLASDAQNLELDETGFYDQV